MNTARNQTGNIHSLCVECSLMTRREEIYNGSDDDFRGNKTQQAVAGEAVKEGDCIRPSTVMKNSSGGTFSHHNKSIKDLRPGN